MKYAVTGHTAGIGKALFEKLSPDCLGFSLSSGYNITKKQDRLKIIDAVRDCDVFINSATDGMGQTLLLTDLFYEWKDTNKTIINVGSRIAEFTTAMWERKMLSYQAEKLILKQMSLMLENACTCNIKYKTFGYVGTEKILLKYPHFKYPEDYISEDEACDILLS